MKSFRAGFLAAVVVLAGVVIAPAQSNQGRIVGRVTDPTGAIVPAASVVIRNTETGIKRELQTNSAGEYVAPNLSPGMYDITASAPTFKTFQRRGIRLEVASNVAVDFQLTPGQISEVMEVSGEQPAIDTITDTLGGALTNKLINELPLQGRDFQNLLELRPGIQRTPGGGFHSVTTNGNRFEDNNYTVDGTDDNDIYYGESVINDAGVAGTPASHLPLDAIQEFNTEENQGAEYGWKPGAVVNVGLKSGTNDFHGTAYYFHRNSALDARNYFNPNPQPVSDLLLHQFGASAGGPIIKDKLFIFGNYEGVRHKVGNPFNVDSPVSTSIGDPSISLPDAETAAGCPALCSPVSLQLAKLFLPNPGSTSSPADPALINFNFNNQNREDNFVVKSDYHLNEKNIITGRFFYANSLQTEEDTAPIRPDWLSIANTKVQVMGANWTWTPNSAWVNEARFGYNRYWQNDNVADNSKSAASYGLNTGVTDSRLFGFPEIDIGSLFVMGGNSSWPLFTSPTYTYQALDNVSLTRGRHQFRFGGEFRHGGTDLFRARRGRGRIVFDDTFDANDDVVSPALVNFLQGNFGDEGFGQILTGDIHRYVTMTAIGAFVADDWRVTPRLTLNLGLRYDLSRPIKDSNNLIANFIPSQGGLIQVGKGINSPYATDWNNFSPRLGIAWDVFGTGKTVLRGGGAIIYEQPTIREFIDRGALNENPSGLPGVTPGNGTIQLVQRELDDTAALSAAWLGKTPLFAGALTTPCDIGDPCDVFGTPYHLSTPYVASWTFNLQQALSPSTSLQIGYVANRGIKLYSHRDINQSDPVASFNCFNNGDDSYHGCRQDTRPFVTNCTTGAGPCLDWAGYATELENHGSSFYNGLQVTLTQRGFKGLNFLAGYTWAHALDNATTNRSGFPQDNRTFLPEWGNGDYDIRHRFTLSMSYELPRLRAPLQLGEGWQLTSIVNLQTGEPYTLFDSSDDISFSGEFLDRWDFSGNPNDVHWTADPAKQITHLTGTDATNNPRCAAQNKNPDMEDVFGCFVSGSAVITPPAYGTFGNMRRNIFRGPAYANLDMSITKRWKLSERINLQLRGEFFNVLNHPNFDGLYTIGTDLSDPVAGINDLGVVNATPDVAASNPVVGSGGSRHIQLGAKLIW
jgi:Carboxypeptidase regulatory-like domain/TonB dependent receptor